jgi:hypothetical protein
MIEAVRATVSYDAMKHLWMQNVAVRFVILFSKKETDPTFQTQRNTGTLFLFPSKFQFNTRRKRDFVDELKLQLNQ